MTTEPTPAVERAAEAIYRRQAAEYRGGDFIPPWVELLVRDPSAQAAYGVDARAALAAALDVEEMARAMIAAIHGGGWWDSDGPIADSIRHNARTRARAIRAAILGEATA